MLYLDEVIKNGSIAAVKKRNGNISYYVKRGIDKRNVFLERKDKEKFIHYLFRAKELGNFELYAYCLMDNHVHLLMKEGEEIGISIKRIAVGYVQWHNSKYDRTGHLFQNRFKSQIVNNDSYLISVARYIHQNPIKAKLVKDIKKYQWSSYIDYINSYNDEKVKVDVELIKAYFKTIESFEEYMKEANNDEFLRDETKKKFTDEEVKIIIEKAFYKKDITKLSKGERDIIIRDIYKLTGASIRQLSSVMGMGRGIIQKAILDVPIETSP